MGRNQNKREEILNAATEVFAEKGYHQATISDLARAGGFGEATVYNYFSNKEEILLTLPLYYLSDLEEKINEHLAGLRQPEEKLRRFIWLYTWWCQNRPKFVRVWLLEIHRQSAYYDSPGYELRNRIMHSTWTMLEEGQNMGQFRKEVDPHLFCCMLTGALNYLFLTRMVFNRELDVLERFDSIAGAIISAITVRPESKKAPVNDRRERIMNAAEALFSEKNFHETRISEIAGLAGVADGSIYDHFQGKEYLLFAIYEKKMADFTASFDEIQAPTRSSTMLHNLLLHFFTWAEANPNWARIYFKDLLPNPVFYGSDYHRAMQNHDKKIEKLLLKGQKDGTFRKNLSLSIFRALIFGALDEFLTPWVMKGEKFDLYKSVASLGDMILNAIGTGQENA